MTAQISSNNSPVAFMCSQSKSVMKEPMMALCSHLFDKVSIWGKPRFICPIDNKEQSLDKCILLPSLKKTIDQWVAKRESLLLAGSLSKLNLPKQEKSVVTFRQIKNVHNDDIHGFLLLKDKTFVSGSKDGSLKRWSDQGVCLNSIGGKTDYRFWVTALASLKNGYWIAGCRDGSITAFNEKCESVKELFYQSGSNQRYISKDRNRNRINCITHNPFKYDKETLFFTGTPRFWQVRNLETGKIIKYYVASDNDWVYCIDPLSSKSAVVVTGSDLDIWTDEYSFYDHRKNVSSEPVVVEDKTVRTNQRPHIAAIARLQNDNTKLATASFDGSIQVLDLESRKRIRRYDEHVGRAWTVANINSSYFATGADDRTVKIWDIRQNKSVMSFDKHPGRVSSILQLSDHRIISGSCSDNPHFSVDKAIITFWDFRKSNLAINKREEKKNIPSRNTPA